MCCVITSVLDCMLLPRCWCSCQRYLWWCREPMYRSAAGVNTGASCSEVFFSALCAFPAVTVRVLPPCTWMCTTLKEECVRWVASGSLKG